MSLAKILEIAKTDDLTKVADWKKRTSAKEIQRELRQALLDLHDYDKGMCQEAVEHYTQDKLAGEKCRRWTSNYFTGWLK